MFAKPKKDFFSKVRQFFVGKPRSLSDQSLMHNISLVAFFAWVGLGADGLSSSCYGPPEAFLVLQQHYYLGIFVALASALTIFIISSSYSQIIEIFPQGGGGYLVASNLLSPKLGMLAGCALLIDYVLTITVSIASGADAIFSFLPAELIPYKIVFAVAILFILILMNMRGARESVIPLVPIFLIFVISHVFAIVYAIVTHAMMLPEVARATSADVAVSSSQLGFLGMILLVLRAYSMGAGTYTGIEAVSNGLPILREPRVKTGKRTMLYMALSLSFMVVGLMIAYLLYRVEPVAGKTLNAVVFGKMTAGWGSWGIYFVLITLISEAAILFVAAQAGFLDGPRVLANMAVDGWAPKRFAILSDRLVTENGVLIMGFSALIMMLATQGSVAFLIVLYSINVFITFMLSQTGMVKHWWQERNKVKGWIRKITVNGIGLIFTVFILISVSVIKFNEGGWITFVITGTLVLISLAIKNEYKNVDKMIQKLEDKIMGPEQPYPDFIPPTETGIFDPKAKTAVFFVKNFNGIGAQTVSTVMHSFRGVFKNVLFVQFGLINSSNLSHMQDVKIKIKREVNQYVDLMKRNGYHSEGFCLTGTDTVDETSGFVSTILKSFPNAVFFGGQVVFPRETAFSRLMHNYTLFAIQRRLFSKGISFFVVPVQL
ncbi:MAG: APC family permease [Candidatus Margulisiibacteriota bacterium]